MKLENMNLDQLIELENQIKIEKSKRVPFWNSLKLIKKKETEYKHFEEEFKKEVESLKSNEQNELEKLGFTIVIFDDAKSIGIINYSIKYDEKNKYYSIRLDKETNLLSKEIEEVSNEDMNKVSKILNARIKEDKKFTIPEIIIDNDIDRESLKDKNGYINCSVLPGVSIDNFPFSERFEIIEDLDLLPEEVNNANFKFGKVNFDTSVIEEEFVYFYHRIFIHAIDPKSYGLKDGLLIITDAGREPEYHTGYLFFRYYKGKFYLIEHYRPTNITPQHIRQLINWRNNNQDDDLNKLYKDYLKIYPKGGHK